MLTEKRISHLLDMMIQHYIHARTEKGLKIAQYLRDYFGMELVYGLDCSTGFRNYQGPITDVNTLLRKER